ncbi:MAG TPA: metalloregulator ArsR/SmtB family transcription factor [Verrucomicrobiae bacterium]|jgi:DNA-binding transcriptional ArsR family regulator|nr:metalloregulator ArsR/SmtB family transcription factor [Verrucomicrobiae bacterium]
MDTNPRALDVLGDPTRRAIVDRLRQGASPVGRLAEGMPVSRPAVSQHLTVLKTAGLVSEHREGTRRIYRLEAAAIEELQRWVEALARDAGRGRPMSSAVSAAVPAAEAPAASVPAEVAAPPDRSGAKADRPAARDDGGKKKHGKKRAGKK